MKIRRNIAYLLTAGTILMSSYNVNKNLEINNPIQAKVEKVGNSLDSNIMLPDSIPVYQKSDLQKNWECYDRLGFNDKETLAYDILGANKDVANNYASAGCSPKEGILNFALRISPEKVNDFEDTKKPNAYLIYGEKDNAGAFIDRDHLKLLRDIGEKYDVSLKVVNNDKDFEKAVDEISNPDLIFLAGHGTGYAIQLGENKLGDEGQNKGVGSESYFDVRDTKIMEKFAGKGNAVCVLYSCWNGRALDDVIKRQAPNLKIIAPNTPTSSRETIVNSIYPMDLDFYHNGENVTEKN